MSSLWGRRPRFPCPQVSALVWDSQGLRKAQFAIFPQWWPPNYSLPLSPLFCLTIFFFFFLPMLLSGGGLGSCPMVPGSFCDGNRKEEEEEQTHTPQTLLSTTALQLCSPSKTPPPTPNHGIFSVAENPSHEQSSSMEIIKHGYFGVMDIVILPFTDPQAHKFRYTA